MARVRSLFDIEVVIEKWQQVIQEVLAGTPVAWDRRVTLQRTDGSGRPSSRLKSAAIGVGTSVLRGYLRYSPFEPGKAWLRKKF